MVTHQYELNESFKALLDGIFSDKEVATKLKIAFEEVVNDRATTQRVNLEKLKDEALEQIRNELLTKDVFYTEMKATKDVFQSEMKAIEAKLEAEIAKIRAEIAEAKTNTIRWVVGVGVTATIVSITANFALINFLIDKLVK